MCINYNNLIVCILWLTLVVDYSFISGFSNYRFCHFELIQRHEPVAVQIFFYVPFRYAFLASSRQYSQFNLLLISFDMRQPLFFHFLQTMMHQDYYLFLRIRIDGNIFFYSLHCYCCFLVPAYGLHTKITFGIPLKSSLPITTVYNRQFSLFVTIKKVSLTSNVALCSYFEEQLNSYRGELITVPPVHQILNVKLWAVFFYSCLSVQRAGG